MFVLNFHVDSNGMQELVTSNPQHDLFRVYRLRLSYKFRYAFMAKIRTGTVKSFGSFLDVIEETT